MFPIADEWNFSRRVRINLHVLSFTPTITFGFFFFNESFQISFIIDVIFQLSFLCLCDSAGKIWRWRFYVDGDWIFWVTMNLGVSGDSFVLICSLIQPHIILEARNNAISQFCYQVTHSRETDTSAAKNVPSNLRVKVMVHKFSSK